MARNVRIPNPTPKKKSVNLIMQDSKTAEQVYRMVVNSKTSELTEIGVAACRNLGITLK